MSSGRAYTMPKLLKSTYLTEGETLLDETRATKLYYFPGPVLLLIIFGILDLQAASTAYGWGASIPYLSSGFQSIANAVSGRILLIALMVITLILVLWLVVCYLRWITTVYAVTTTRVIVQSGLLGRNFDEIPIHQVRGVDVHQSFGQRMLGYGKVRVSAETGSASSIGNEDWLGIPHPFKFQKLIESATQDLARSNTGTPAASAAPRN